MKKTLSQITITALAALGMASLNTSCLQTEAATVKAPEKAPENGAQFRKGEGLSLTNEMKKSIGLQIAEVGEEKIASSLSLDLTALNPREASGPVTPQQAALLKPGMTTELRTNDAAPAVKGTILRIDKIPFGAPGGLEVTVGTEQPLAAGSNLKAGFDLPASGEVPAIPAAALLKTAEGTFVYAVNGNFYVRTPVKTGARNNALVEITDGLYSGDQIVTTPVMSLWMAELQVLRGGKACTCGH